jgi:hypothetical protein
MLIKRKYVYSGKILYRRSYYNTMLSVAKEHIELTTWAVSISQAKSNFEYRINKELNQGTKRIYKIECDKIFEDEFYQSSKLG